MSETTIECTKCGAPILQSTAIRNDGLCKPCASGPKIEHVTDGMEFGMRLLLGVVFAVVIGGVGYGIGSLLGAIGGIIIAIPFALVGLIYGCFCVEINAAIRSVVPFMLDR